MLTAFAELESPPARPPHGCASAATTKSLTVKADGDLYSRCNIHPTQMEGEIEPK